MAARRPAGCGTPCALTVLLLSMWTCALATAPRAGAIAPRPALGCTVPTVSISTVATSVPIPDNTPAGVSKAVAVTGLPGAITDVDVTTFIAHTAPADLDVTVTSPSGTVVTLTSDNGGLSVNAFNGTLWDDQAGGFGLTSTSFAGGVQSPLTPEEPLGAFNRQNPNGTWTITAVDDGAGNTGALGFDTFTLRTVIGGPPG